MKKYQGLKIKIKQIRKQKSPEKYLELISGEFRCWFYTGSYKVQF